MIVTMLLLAGITAALVIASVRVDRSPPQSALQAEGVWLVGSLGSGRGDEWSDVDIIVAGGECVLDGTLLTLEMPADGPAGGGYVGAM